MLSTLGLYGPSVLFVVLLVGAVGVPAPGSLLLLVAGSFVEQGEMNLWQVLALACAGSGIGGNVGYALGRLGGGHGASRLRHSVCERRLLTSASWLEGPGGGGIF